MKEEEKNGGRDDSVGDFGWHSAKLKAGLFSKLGSVDRRHTLGRFDCDHKYLPRYWTAIQRPATYIIVYLRPRLYSVAEPVVEHCISYPSSCRTKQEINRRLGPFGG